MVWDILCDFKFRSSRFLYVQPATVQRHHFFEWVFWCFFKSPACVKLLLQFGLAHRWSFAPWDGKWAASWLTKAKPFPQISHVCFFFLCWYLCLVKLLGLSKDLSQSSHSSLQCFLMKWSFRLAIESNVDTHLAHLKIRFLLGRAFLRLIFLICNLPFFVLSVVVSSGSVGGSCNSVASLSALSSSGLFSSCSRVLLLNPGSVWVGGRGISPLRFASM